MTISFKLEDLKEAEVLDTASVDPQALCTERGASSKGAFGPFGLLAMASKDLEEQTAIFFRVFQNQNGGYSVLMCSDLSRFVVIYHRFTFLVYMTITKLSNLLS